MTHEEVAQRIVTEHIPQQVSLAVNRDKLTEAIRSALVSASNEELEKKRNAERELENMKAGGPVIVREVRRVSLRVWNPATQSWWQTEMTDQKSYIP